MAAVPPLPQPIALTVNGNTHPLTVGSNATLLQVLRNDLGLNGPKYGCGLGQCGACTVHVDGVAVRSCTAPLSSVAGKKITTIEAVAADQVGQAVQDAWVAHDVAQCGYCQSGQIMSATALLKTNRKPSDADIDAAMAGNICRCGTYARVRSAIKAAASTLA